MQKYKLTRIQAGKAPERLAGYSIEHFGQNRSVYGT
jgi:hypothetical protein